MLDQTGRPREALLKLLTDISLFALNARADAGMVSGAFSQLSGWSHCVQTLHTSYNVRNVMFASVNTRVAQLDATF